MRKLFALIVAAILLTTPVLAADGPATDTPAADDPAADAPAVDTPAADDPAVDASTIDIPAGSADQAVCAHHFELTVLREATCSAKGLLAYTCSKCGLTYTAETLADGEHDYELTRSTATCTEDGKNTYVCTQCGDSYTEDAPATGHVPEDEPASCTHSQLCSVCGEVLVPATGHDYQYQYDAEQDADGGFVTYGTWACANCGRVLNATQGNALYYYSLPQRPAAAGSDTDTDAVTGEATDTDAAAGEAATDTDAGSQDSPDPKTGLWIAISAVALVLIVAEAVVLIRSLNKKKVER